MRRRLKRAESYRIRVLVGFASAGIGLVTAPLLGQSAAASTTTAASISISGDVSHPMTLSATDLAAMPRRSVRAATERGQPEATYDGVALRDVLARAGVAFGPAIRGPALATYVLCSAADGYRVVFALAELDSAFSDRTIILADHKDGQALDARTGPFRIVVPGDARGARWIRQLTGLIVARPPDSASTQR